MKCYRTTHTKYPRKAVWILIAAASSFDFPAKGVFVTIRTSVTDWSAETAAIAGTAVITSSFATWLLSSFSATVISTSSGWRGGAGGGSVVLTVSKGAELEPSFCFPNHFFFDF